jgi:iron-sulfur cluster repair protein YtfE (RIC family)
MDTATEHRPTDAFRAEHRALMAHVEHIRDAARRIAGQSTSERRDTVDRLTEFLVDTLIPHAQAEERVLYPAWSSIVGYDHAADAMIIDHEAIVERIRRLEQVDVSDTEELQELLYGLHALITVHFRKEEELQLPVFDARPADEVAAMLERMHAGHAHQH